MATIINNPDSGTSGDSSGGMGFLIGTIVLILVLILFFVYGLPAIRGTNSSTKKVDVNVTTPSSTSSGSATGSYAK